MKELSAETLIAALPDTQQITQWPVALKCLVDTFEESNHDCYLPEYACRAVGGTATDAIPGCIAIAAAEIAIIITDDILDQEHGGLHTLIGEGPAANLAMHMQGLSASVFDNA